MDESQNLNDATKATANAEIAPHPSGINDINNEAGGCVRIYNAFAGFLFPRMTPIPPLAFFVLSLVVAIP